MAKRGNSINRKRRRKAKKAREEWERTMGNQVEESDWFELPHYRDDEDDERTDD